MKTDLRRIPGIGPKTEQSLIALGYPSVESLKNADPEAMYAVDCARCGCRLDPCVLYVYRLAVYFASAEHKEPEKLKWWYWKDGR